MNRDVSAHYDSISSYMFWTNRLRNLGEVDLSFHRILQIPDSWRYENPNETESNYLNDIIIETLSLPKNPHVLDAGCGFGGTIFWLHNKLGGYYDGITLSYYQVKVARRYAQQMQKGSMCNFHFHSYDEPISSVYDAVITIESLVHSKNLSHTISNLGNALVPGGRLLMIEDVLSSNFSSTSSDLDMVMRTWKIHCFPTEQDYSLAFKTAGLVKTTDQDLSEKVKLAAPTLIPLAIKTCALFAKTPNTTVRSLATFHYAQFLLHRLYHQDKVKYRLIVAKKL